MSWVVGGLVGVDVADRDQGQAQVTDSLEQAVEGCLVGDRAADDGGAVALMGDGQAVEPGGPVRVKVPREPDLVASGLGARAPDVRCSVMPLLVRVSDWAGGRYRPDHGQPWKRM